MILLELACLAIILVYLAGALARAPVPARYLRRYTLLAVAAWLAENSCIRLYGFYTYSPDWSFFLDRVPLAIILIWPIVILSARELTSHLFAGQPRRAVAAASFMVLADASFMEPIAVAAGLWRWHEPGFFAVPPIGVWGWALFTGACSALLAANERRDRSPAADLWLLPLAPLATHLLLLASWWSLCRWISAPIAPWLAVAAAWLVSLTVSSWALTTGACRKIPPSPVATRIPAAGFFFVLLLLYGLERPGLLFFALAFAPPYLILIDWRTLGARLKTGPR